MTHSKESSLQLHVEKAWKSWAALIFQALSSEETQTAGRCRGTLVLPSQTASLSPANCETLNSPLVFRKEEVKKPKKKNNPQKNPHPNTSIFVTCVREVKKGPSLAYERRYKKARCETTVFPHNHITNLLKKRLTNIHDPTKKRLREPHHQWHKYWMDPPESHRKMARKPIETES